jgi:HK97 family phage portal protein
MKKRTGFLHSLRSRFIHWLDPDTGLPRYSNYYPTDSGVNVSAESAMRVTTVFACVRIISWTLASLPLPLYRRLAPRGKERATEHPLYALLHDRPNPEQTAFEFRALLQTQALLYGNGYAEIEFDRFGLPVALWPVPSWRCRPRRGKTRELFYELTLPDGTQKALQAYQVFHVKGLTLDGDEGLSVIAAHRQGLGLTLAAEEFGARFFGQGANVGGVVTHPGRLSPEAYERLKKSLEEKHEGLGKSHRMLLLEEAMKYEKVGIPPNDAQFLETRRFQIADTARMFGVPSHMVNDTERTTSWGSGIEEQGIGFVVYTMGPWFVNWEQQIARKLLINGSALEYFAEFLVAGLLRGNMAARYAAYAIGRQWGWLSADDVRDLENMNPLPNDQGAIYLNPMNMVAAGSMPRPAPDQRMRVIASFRRVLEDAAVRVLRREEADIMRQAKKLDPKALGPWLERFYQDHLTYIERQLQPPAQAMVEAAELGINLNLASLAAWHAKRSLAQLEEALAGRDPAAALQARFDEWEAGRPGELAAAVVQYALEGRMPS